MPVAGIITTVRIINADRLDRGNRPRVSGRRYKPILLFSRKLLYCSYGALLVYSGSGSGFLDGP